MALVSEQALGKDGSQLPTVSRQTEAAALVREDTFAVNPSLLQVALLPLDSSTRADVVTRQLQQAIALGLLSDGTPLPSESDLAAQLQVSNVTLRASLAELRREGLIETRRGRGGGSFIRSDAGHDQPILRRQLLSLNIDEIRDTRDLQVGVTGRAAYLAAERARGYELTKLGSFARSLGTADTPNGRVKADFRFHGELAAATRSAQLTRVEVGVMTALAPLLWIDGHESRSATEASDEHQEIVAAIIARDRDLARSLAEDHVHRTLDGLIELRMDLARDEESA